MATNENLPPKVIKQLAKELKNLHDSPPEGIKVDVNDDNFAIIYAYIEGPAGTPYENGVFRMKLILSRDFPHSPPEGYFLTKIFHPNVRNDGKICVNALKNDWSPTLGLRHVLMVIRCLLINPFPESALNDMAGKMLLDNYDEYAKTARMYTGLHAIKPNTKLKAGAISESTIALNVDPTSVSVCSADQKNAEPSAALPVPSPLAPSSNSINGGNSQEHRVLVPKMENVGTSMPVPLTQKKEVSFAKPQVDKKKIDARKKSLKRL